MENPPIAHWTRSLRNLNAAPQRCCRVTRADGKSRDIGFVFDEASGQYVMDAAAMLEFAEGQDVRPTLFYNQGSSDGLPMLGV